MPPRPPAGALASLAHRDASARDTLGSKAHPSAAPREAEQLASLVAAAASRSGAKRVDTPHPRQPGLPPGGPGGSWNPAGVHAPAEISVSTLGFEREPVSSELRALVGVTRGGNLDMRHICSLIRTWVTPVDLAPHMARSLSPSVAQLEDVIRMRAAQDKQLLGKGSFGEVRCSRLIQVDMHTAYALQR